MKGEVVQCGGRQWLLLPAELLAEGELELVSEGNCLVIRPLKSSLRKTLAQFTADFMPAGREQPDA